MSQVNPFEPLVAELENGAEQYRRKFAGHPTRYNNANASFDQGVLEGLRWAIEISRSYVDQHQASIIAHQQAEIQTLRQQLNAQESNG